MQISDIAPGFQPHSIIQHVSHTQAACAEKELAMTPKVPLLGELYMGRDLALSQYQWIMAMTGPFHCDLLWNGIASSPGVSHIWILSIQLSGLKWFTEGNIPSSLLSFLNMCSKTWKARARHAIEKPWIQSMVCKRKPLYHYVGKQKKKTLESVPSLSLYRESNSLCLQSLFNPVR